MCNSPVLALFKDIYPGKSRKKPVFYLGNIDKHGKTGQNCIDKEVQKGYDICVWL